MTAALNAVLPVVAATAKKSSGGSSVLLIFIVIGAAFYFLIYRPQQKKARAAREVGNTFDVGDEVLTAGGIVGYVIDIDGDRVTLETSVGASFVVMRQYILRKLVEPDAVDDDGDDHLHDDDDEYGDAQGVLETSEDDPHHQVDGPDHDGASPGPEDATPPAAGHDDDGDTGGRGSDGRPIT